MGKTKRCLYIDGSNLYGGISDLLAPGEYIDMATILPIIDAEFGGIDMIKVYGAYMGRAGITDPKDILFRKAQNEFFNSVTSLKGVYFGKGYISKHGKEKGVDMKLGVDMVHDAYENSFHEAIIVSGDADFLYPIQYLTDKGKVVHYCAFATRFTFPIAFKTGKKVVLDYKHYFAKRVLPTTKKVPHSLNVVDIDKLVKIKNA